MRRRPAAASFEAIGAVKRLEPLALYLSYPEAVAAWIDRRFVTTTSEASLKFDRPALAAYEIQPGECVPPMASLWLFAVREVLEGDGEVAKAAWCVSCGVGCTDRRGHVARVRQWCDRCLRLRHRPAYRRCASADCLGVFWSTRSNELFCSAACTEAERRRGRGGD